MRVVVGNSHDECEAQQLDLTKLVDTRMLISANSGSGKSWLLRLIAERAAGNLQTIILDPEGEFSTLRERVDCVLVGPGGELPTNVRAAGLLARKLMELQVSAVVDLYDLNIMDRRKFVRLFLESLMHLPKELWHPCLFIIDECHKFAPEKGAGESEATSAVIDLMSQGRKRGYCLPGYELVWTNAGLKRISDIVIGDMVLTHRGRFRRVLATSRRPYAGSLISTKTWNHSIATTTTPNHRFLGHLTRNNGAGTRVLAAMDWFSADKLSRGDRTSYRLFSPALLDVVDREAVDVAYFARGAMPLTKKGRKRRRPQTHSLPLSDAALSVFGWYLAEGSVGYRQHQRTRNLSKVIFSLGDHEPERIEGLKRDLRQLGYRPYLVHQDASVRVCVSSRGLAELLSHLFGTSAASKNIPMFLLQLPAEKLKIMLHAYVFGDGNTRRDSPFRAIASSVSVDLATCWSLVADKCGFFFSLRGPYKSSDVIQGRKVTTLPKYIMGFSEAPRTAKRVSGLSCYSIRSLESREFSGDVFNIEVDEDQSFCTVSHVVHNCGIVSTQRLSKLHKDVCAEANNVVLGRTWLDVDVKRSNNILGDNYSDKLSELTAGEFYSFGPAFSMPQVVKFRSDKVRTTHPESGKRHQIQPPKPSKAIERVIKQLTDLPAKAEEEIRDLAAAKAEIAKLKREVAAKPKPAADETTVKTAVDIALRDQGWQWTGREAEYKKCINILQQRLIKIGNALESPLALARDTLLTSPAELLQNPPVQKTVFNMPRVIPTPPAERHESNGSGPRSGQRRMLIALAQRPQGLTRKQLAVRAGMAQSGTFNTYLSAARANAWLKDDGQLFQITDAGLASLGSYDPLPTGRELLNYWLGQLGESGAARMLQAAVDAWPNALTKAELCEQAGMKQSGTAGTYLSKLRTLQLIEGKVELRASAELFD